MLEVIAKDQTRLDSVLKLLFSHISPSTGDNFTCARAKVNETQVIQQAFQPSQSGGCEALTQSLLCGFVHQKSRFSDKAVRVLVSKKNSVPRLPRCWRSSSRKIALLQVLLGTQHAQTLCDWKDVTKSSKDTLRGHCSEIIHPRWSNGLVHSCCSGFFTFFLTLAGFRSQPWH